MTIENPELKEDFLFLAEAVEAAGKLALGYFGNAPASQKKSDGSDVSEADLAVNSLLRDKLTAHRPDYGWLSEESEDKADRLDRERVWVVDPIDGTRAFLNEKPEWVVSAALVVAGEPTAAAVFNPVKGAFYKACSGQGAWKNDSPLSLPEVAAPDRLPIIISNGHFRKGNLDTAYPAITRIWVNSIAYRICLVAEGKAFATVSLSNKNEWDLAAAHLILSEAGGLLTTRSNEIPGYNNPNPLIESIVAAAPVDHRQILDHLNAEFP